MTWSPPLSDGGYELGPRAAVAAVPEPASVVSVPAGHACCARSVDDHAARESAHLFSAESVERRLAFIPRRRNTATGPG